MRELKRDLLQLLTLVIIVFSGCASRGEVLEKDAEGVNSNGPLAPKEAR